MSQENGMGAENTSGASATPTAKVQQSIGLLDSIRVGSSVDGRWLDARGDECEETDPDATFERYTAEEQVLWLSSVAENARRAADLLAAPDVQQALSAEPAADLRAIGVLKKLLDLTKTDAWSLGSSRLDDALAEAREIVAAAGPEYVIFSQSEFDASGDGVGFWSNEEGWTDRENATVFFDRERHTRDLPHPIDAQWVSMAEAHGNELIVGGPKP